MIERGRSHGMFGGFVLRDCGQESFLVSNSPWSALKLTENHCVQVQSTSPSFFLLLFTGSAWIVWHSLGIRKLSLLFFFAYKPQKTPTVQNLLFPPFALSLSFFEKHNSLFMQAQGFCLWAVLQISKEKCLKKNPNNSLLIQTWEGKKREQGDEDRAPAIIPRVRTQWGVAVCGWQQTRPLLSLLVKNVGN